MKNPPTESTLNDVQVSVIKLFLEEQLLKKRRPGLPSPEIFAHMKGQIPADWESQFFCRALSLALHANRMGPFRPKQGRNGGVRYIPELAGSKHNPPPLAVKKAEDSPSNPPSNPSSKEPTIAALLEEPEEKPEEDSEENDSNLESSEDVGAIAKAVMQQIRPVVQKVAEPTKLIVPVKVETVVTFGDKDYSVPLSVKDTVSVLVDVFAAEVDESGSIKVGDQTYKVADERVQTYFENFLFFFLGSIQKYQYNDRGQRMRLSA